MKTAWMGVLALASLALVGCGDDSGTAGGKPGGFEGAWALDGDATAKDAKEAYLKRGREFLAKADAELKKVEEEAKGLPEAEREQKLGRKRADLGMGAWEFSAAFKAHLKSPAEGLAALETGAGEYAERMKQGRVAIALKPDHTYASRSERAGDPPRIDVETGTWSREGDQLTTTRATRNGMPDTAKPDVQAVTLTGDVLVVTRKDLRLTFRRTSTPVDERPDPARINPCTLLTQDEVSAAVGEAVGPCEPLASSEGAEFGKPDDPKKRLVAVYVDRGAAEVAEFQKRYGKYKKLDGVGDEAYVVDSNAFGRKGTTVFTVNVRLFNEKGAAAAAAIAKLIASRLK